LCAFSHSAFALVVATAWRMQATMRWPFRGWATTSRWANCWIVQWKAASVRCTTPVSQCPAWNFIRLFS